MIFNWIVFSNLNDVIKTRVAKSTQGGTRNIA